MVAYWTENLDASAPFAFDNVYRFPVDELDGFRELAAAAPKKVVIIGAGIAGLVAAHELESLGFQTEVLELTDRIGGRIRTAVFDDGTHVELGAMRIPGNHACTLHYVDKFQLPRRRFVNYNREGWYRLRGGNFRQREWRKAADKFDLRTAEIREPLRLLEREMESALARLSAGEKYQLFHSRSPGIVEEYDRRTLRQHLEAVNLTEEAIQFLGHATGLIHYERASFLEALIDYFGLLRVDQFELVDGMHSLPDAVSRSLSNSVHLRDEVERIQVSPEGVVVHSRSSSGLKKWDADYVICTVPARRAAMIEWHPGLSTQKLDALYRLYYASSAKTVVHSATRIWETEQGIFGGGSFTDEVTQQTWYPSDNAAPASDIVYAGITGDDLDQTATSIAPAQWTAKSPRVSAGPGALTASYTWENNARFMASLTENERTRIVLDYLEKLHPGIRGHVTDVRHIVWDQESGTGGGAFAYFAPGEHSRYLAAIREPHSSQDQRVYFAGEHVSVVHAWIQGSIQSALQAVLDIAKVATMSSSDNGRGTR